MPIQQHDVKLNWAKLITPTVLHLAFAPVSGEKIPFIPGQFITFLFKADDKIMRRSYSIATIPTESEDLEIAVSPVNGGLATDILFKLQNNDILSITAPVGRLTLPAGNHPTQYVLAATGTGVSPYRSMLPRIGEILHESPNTQFTVLLGVRQRHDLLYAADFLNFARQHERFNFRAYLSRETELTAPHEYNGYLHQAFKELKLNPEQDLIYLCGNPSMIDTSLALLVEAGFSTTQVKREKYLSPKY